MSRQGERRDTVLEILREATKPLGLEAIYRTAGLNSLTTLHALHQLELDGLVLRKRHPSRRAFIWGPRG